MVTAGYLTRYFSRVTIIESDDVINGTLLECTPEQLLNYRCELESPTSLGRSGVPQIFQLHVIEGEGHRILRELFPRLDEQLCRDYGISIYSLKEHFRICINGVTLNNNLTEDFKWLGADRFTLETVLRKQLYDDFNDRITWKPNSRVMQLIVDSTLNTVKGVKYRNRKDTTSASSALDMYGDFIVDCSGRYSSSTKRLKESLDVDVPTTQIYFGSGYVTFVGERFKTGNAEFDTKPLIGYTADSPRRNTGLYATAIRRITPTDENSLGILSTITLHCVNSEFPPSDSFESILAWAKDNLDSDHYSVLESTQVRGPLAPYRRAIDERKYVEALGKQWPHNYILLGDAMCTFNPQFGQGMTHACRQAKVLAEIFAKHNHRLQDISHVFNARAAAVSEECWLLSASNDWKTPTLKVVTIDRSGHSETRQRDGDSTTKQTPLLRAPILIRFLQWYTYWFLQCAEKSGPLSTDFLRIVNQYSGPLLLLRPTTVFAVCSAALMGYFKAAK